MGVNLNAITDHALSQPEIVRLDQTLRAEWLQSASPLRAVERMPGRTTWQWNLLTSSATPEQEFEAQGFLEFDGPVDLHGTIFLRALELGSAIRWGRFLGDPDTQLALCRATRRVAQIARGKMIIYLSDFVASGITSEILHDGGDIHAVLSYLSNEYGRPATSFHSLEQAWGTAHASPTYYVEHLD